MSGLRGGIKLFLDTACLVLIGPAVLTTLLEGRVRPHSERIFEFWAQTFALVPGLPGSFLRRAFYRMALERCAARFFVGFGAMFSHRRAVIEEDVYVGPYAIVGSSVLRRGCLIGSRASIVSGRRLHTLDSQGRWTPSDLSQLEQIEIGEDAWIGEAAVIMADIGRSSMVAAGSVVSTRVPPGVMVAGNPARFVRTLAPAAEESRHTAGVASA